MRASEFALIEGKASRQSSMNARRPSTSIQPQSATTDKPTASTETSAPALAFVKEASTANPVNPNVKPGGSKEAQAFRAQQAALKQPAASGTDWNALTQATAPAKPSTGSSYLDKIKQSMYSTGKGLANKFSTQGKIASRTDQLFMEKFLKDMNSAEQTITGLRGDTFDIKTWVDEYLTKNNWQAGNQQAILDKAVASNNKKAIAKSMAAIGKYNNLGSTMRAKATAGQATANGNQAIGQIATQLTQPNTTTAKPAVQVSLGGKPGQPNTLDPANPVDAKILSMLKQQGKI